ncbi:hypothetical protein ACO0LC_28990 [Undibacterium sp. JH2W]|uniref:hypothetical protein n=1 Tax=Undibacterium sp. JH2W TaxID=3413037 RepID=UPI003BF226D8
MTQVKYKETQDFAFSKIREPVVQLIEEAYSDKSAREYFLYCHFKDRSESTHTFTINELEDLLKIALGKKPSQAHRDKVNRISKITDDMKQKFVKRFKIKFAPDQVTNFSRVITLIANQPFCSNQDEALFFYCFISDYFRKLVTNNADPSKRKCTRQEVVAALQSGKRNIFYSAFSEYESREKFLAILKKRFQRPLASQTAFIFIGKREHHELTDIGDLLLKIINQHFHKAVYNVEPITFVLHDDDCVSAKKYLIKNDVAINDGYEAIEFSNGMFNRHHISIRKSNRGKATESLGEISFKARVIGINSFRKLTGFSFPPEKIYYFGVDEEGIFSNVPMFSVDSINAKEIWHLFQK